jgi:hypothetical protein
MGYEIEEEEGGYVRSGDVLEWRWKGTAEPKSEVVTTETGEAVVPPKKKATARKRTTRKKR